MSNPACVKSNPVASWQPHPMLKDGPTDSFQHHVLTQTNHSRPLANTQAFTRWSHRFVGWRVARGGALTPLWLSCPTSDRLQSLLRP